MVWLIPMHADPSDQPPALTWSSFFTVWTWDWAAISIAIGVVAYAIGVRRLTQRGDRWPVGRTIYWMVGMATLLYATNGALGAYDTVLFSIHMVQHMILAMVAPVFLAQGAPMTLALRVLPVAPRARLVRIVHSRVAKFLLFPPLTTALMIVTPFALYPTGLYDITLRNSFAHDLLHVFMFSSGCAFFWPLLGSDPTPWKLPYPFRILLFFLTMPFHAFIGVMLMGSSTLVSEDWYLSFNRTWGPSPMNDQYLAGGILWATGDLTMFTTMSAMFVLWWRDSQREAKREDRRLDREEALAAAAADRAGAAGTGPAAAGATMPDDVTEAAGSAIRPVSDDGD